MCKAPALQPQQDLVETAFHGKNTRREGSPVAAAIDAPMIL
jgi:hypothetical protein